jgi:hypothetical protein
MNIKIPMPVTNWVSSDGKTFKSHDDAHCHEVFLAILPRLPKTIPASARDVIMELAKHFDITPRSAKKSPPEEQSWQ